METTVSKNEKWSYNNRWLNYLNCAVILIIFLLLILILISELSIEQSTKLYMIFFAINIISMFVTAFFILSFVHYKSPYNFIIVDHDCLIVPKSTILPDSIYISFDQIIYDDLRVKENFYEYQLFYNGGSVILKQRYLKDRDTWSGLVFQIKEMID